MDTPTSNAGVIYARGPSLGCRNGPGLDVWIVPRCVAEPRAKRAWDHPMVIGIGVRLPFLSYRASIVALVLYIQGRTV